MSLVKEFKEFAMRGNVVDMAVGLVIGAAFGGIVKSFVDNIIMPPLNLITARAGINFKDLALKVQTLAPDLDEAGKPILKADGTYQMSDQLFPILKYGAVLQVVLEFMLIAAAIFIVIKMMNKAKERFEKEAEAAPPAEPSEDVLLLREIRDSLAKK